MVIVYGPQCKSISPNNCSMTPWKLSNKIIIQLDSDCDSNNAPGMILRNGSLEV